MSPKINRYFTKTIKKVRQRVWGYKVRSGRTLTDTMSKAGPVLPNKQNPVVVRVVTRSELAAIPKDRYNVKVIKAMVPSQKTGEPGVEEELLVAISESEQHTKRLKRFRQELRVKLRRHRGGGGPPPPPSSLFNPPIKEDLMADCIIEVMDNFFHGEEKCTICNQKYGRMEFCVLMHIFLKYIGFLKNESRLSYSEFLQEKVFVGKSKFGERTFNTYANKEAYQKLRKQLETLKVDFKSHPKLPPDPNESILKPAFQEIGRAFQHSDYFTQLIELKKNLQKLDI